jgi:plastocyanin
MVADTRHPDPAPPRHSVTRPRDVAAGWLIALLILIAAVLLIGPQRFLDTPRIPQKLPLERVRGTGDVLMDGHTFAPGAVAAHPGDRLVFWNVGKELEALNLAGHAGILQQRLVDPGARFTFVIPPSLKPGTYHLICTTHPDMSLTLAVRAQPATSRPDVPAPASGSPPAVVRTGWRKERATWP